MSLLEKPNTNVSKFTKFLWWCAGADPKFLLLSSHQDRVKYAGIGGIVLSTGLLAMVSGWYAFITIFGPKGDAMEDLPSSIIIKISAILFALIWGAIIFNIDRFIVSSTGKGDGTDTMSGNEIKNAIPRILMAVILSFAISAPLEIKILESEINGELSKYQKKYTEELNTATDVVFKQKLSKLEKDKIEYENKFHKYESELKAFDNEIDNLIARQQSEMQDKRAYGFGPVAKKMQADIDTKRLEKDKFIALKKSEVSSYRKQLDFMNDQINKMSDELREAYKENEKRSHQYDGLLKRIQISHEIGGIIPWLIFLVFLSIETGPIFFKMMINKGPYDYMVENNNYRMYVQNGIVKEEYVFEGRDGMKLMEKVNFLEVENDRKEKVEQLKAQHELSKQIIGTWSGIKQKEIENNPAAYFDEGKNSTTKA